ncbi:hypothetical protein HY086_05415 [Candidatus Gottesmanbacteria bacterium]|nr:hypothetical protein [Candidatus Gottesmanbacteria bacterium]
MTQLVVRIPEEQKQMLMLIAQTERQPLSRVVRGALDTFITAKKHQHNDLLRLLEIANKYKGPVVPKDLSTNYKRYLYGDKRI